MVIDMSKGSNVAEDVVPIAEVGGDDECTPLVDVMRITSLTSHQQDSVVDTTCGLFLLD